MNANVSVVQSLVAEHFQVSSALVAGARGRKNRFVKARYTAFWLCRNVLGMGVVDIGRKFDRDHATIMHGIKRYEDR